MNIRKHCLCGEQEGMEGNVRYKGKCIFLHPLIAGSKRGEIGGLSLSIVQFFLTSYIVAPTLMTWQRKQMIGNQQLCPSTLVQVLSCRIMQSSLDCRWDESYAWFWACEHRRSEWKYLRNPKETRREKTQESADATVNIRMQSHLFCAIVSRWTKFT